MIIIFVVNIASISSSELVTNIIGDFLNASENFENSIAKVADVNPR